MNLKPTDTSSADDALDAILDKFGRHIGDSYREYGNRKALFTESQKMSGANAKLALQAWKQEAIDAATTEAVKANNELHNLHGRNIDDVVREAVVAELKRQRDEPSLAPDCPTTCTKRHWHHVVQANINLRIAELQTKPKKETAS